MASKRLYQAVLDRCSLCGGCFQRKTSKASYCCAAHRQRAYRLRRDAKVAAILVTDEEPSDRGNNYSPTAKKRSTPKKGRGRAPGQARKKNGRDS